MSTLLFFVALLPDAKIRKEVTDFKQYLATHFGASHALKSPPHITLFPPFKWQPNGVEVLTETLERFTSAESPFDVVLQNFNRFAPRVIYVDVKKNEQLTQLQQRLEAYFATSLNLKNDRDQHDFSAHMTIAHKDLRRELFKEAWNHFSSQTYERTFRVEHITLLRHNGTRWEIFQEFPLRGMSKKS